MARNGHRFRHHRGPFLAHHCYAEFGRYRAIADFRERSARQIMDSRRVFIRFPAWFLAVHMRHHPGEVAHVNQFAAHRTVSEMLDLRPVRIIHVDASVAGNC